jgi:hypothetical protein
MPRLRLCFDIDFKPGLYETCTNHVLPDSVYVAEDPHCTLNLLRAGHMLQWILLFASIHPQPGQLSARFENVFYKWLFVGAVQCIILRRGWPTLKVLIVSSQ